MLDATFWDHQALQASPGAHNLLVGGKAVLFDEGSQKLFEHNETAAALWQAIVTEATLAGAAKTLASDETEYELALQYARESALQWLRMGLLRPACLSAGSLVDGKPIKLGWMDCCVELEIAGGLDAAPLLKVFGSVVSTKPLQALLRVELVGDLVFIWEDKGPLCARSRDAWIPEIKARLTAKILETSETGFLVHAGLVSRNNRGLLICGEPGAGKTTLSVSLALDGFDYHADDIVQVSDAGEVSGAPFAPALKEGGWPLLLEMNNQAEISPPYLRGDGQAVRYLLLPAVQQAPATLGAILLLARQDAGPAQIEPVEPLEVLTTVLASAYSAKGSISPAGLRSLIDVIEHARIGRLVYSDWSDARRAVEDFAP